MIAIQGWSNLCTWLLGLAVVVAASGCGKDDGKRPVFPVNGKVLIDGKPGTDARLLFVPTNASDSAALRVTAVADQEGNLIVTTYATGDGAPAGEYKVAIEWPKQVNGVGRVLQGADRLNGKYKDAATSKWTVRITEGPNTLPDFEINTK